MQSKIDRGLAALLLVSIALVGAASWDVAHYAFRADRVTATVVKIKSDECGSRQAVYPCWRTALVSWSDHGQARVTALREFYGSSSPSPTVSYYDDPTGGTLMGRRVAVIYRHGDGRPAPLDPLRWEYAWFVFGWLGIAIGGFAGWRRIGQIRPAQPALWRGTRWRRR